MPPDKDNQESRSLDSKDDKWMEQGNDPEYLEGIPENSPSRKDFSPAILTTGAIVAIGLAGFGLGRASKDTVENQPSIPDTKVELPTQDSVQHPQQPEMSGIKTEPAKLDCSKCPTQSITSGVRDTVCTVIAKQQTPPPKKLLHNKYSKHHKPLSYRRRAHHHR